MSLSLRNFDIYRALVHRCAATFTNQSAVINLGIKSAIILMEKNLVALVVFYRVECLVLVSEYIETPLL